MESKSDFYMKMTMHCNVSPRSTLYEKYNVKVATLGLTGQCKRGITS